MDFQLLIVRGRSASETIKLADGVTTLGRHDDCQLRIKSSQVSRKHCEIFEKKGILLVKDLGSSNGTYVNGKRVVDQRVLEPGDELTVGGVSFKVAKVGQAPPGPAPEKPTPKPGDTAIVGPAAAGAPDDDFEIEFDEQGETSEPDLDFQEEETIPAPAAQKPAEPERVPKAEPGHESEPVLADDAVADFLLDIKFDDEE